jgi:Kef-type K+ transport system membrane component KefB
VEATQSYLLEVVSWIGVLFLLLLTGLETDVALIRAQGRPALLTALTGVIFPFLLGAGVGYLLPESLLTAPESRLVLALFLGTVLSVSSVPVIAKILREMQLLRRNVGQLILAAALAHDTIGWLLLGVVASLAAGSRLDLAQVGRTVLGTGLFLLLCATVGRPAVRWLLRRVNDRSRGEHALLSAIILLMLLGAAMTQVIGVHAVLGAFVIGILLREAPVVNERVVHPIETTTTALFAPIFFAAAGLHVDLAALARPELTGYAALLVGAACLGKIAGCYLGARLGGVGLWEALAVGFGTNARGAMGLIVGILGFSLGILTVEVFSLIILMAVATTAMGPPLLRWALARVKPGDAEAERLRQEVLRERSFIGRVQRVLIPSRGGSHALLAARLVDAVAEQQRIEVTGLYVPAGASDTAGAATLEALRQALAGQQAQFHAVTSSPSAPVPAILKELARGYDLLAMGCGPAAGEDGLLFGRLVDQVAREAGDPHAGSAAALLIVRAPAAGPPPRIARILVPTATAMPSVYAAEFAVAVARASGAALSALHVDETADEELFWLMDPEQRAQEAGWDAVEQVRGLAEAYGVPVATQVVRGRDAGAAILRAAAEEEIDLIVLGGSPRATRRLYLGASVDRVVRDASCAVAVLRA